MRASSIITMILIVFAGLCTESTAHAQLDADGFIKSWDSDVFLHVVDEASPNGAGFTLTNFIQPKVATAWNGFDLCKVLDGLIPQLKPGATSGGCHQGTTVELRAKQLTTNVVALRALIPGNVVDIVVPNVNIGPFPTTVDFTLTFTAVVDATLSANSSLDGASPNDHVPLFLSQPVGHPADVSLHANNSFISDGSSDVLAFKQTVQALIIDVPVTLDLSTANTALHSFAVSQGALLASFYASQAQKTGDQSWLSLDASAAFLVSSFIAAKDKNFPTDDQRPLVIELTKAPRATAPSGCQHFAGCNDEVEVWCPDTSGANFTLERLVGQAWRVVSTSPSGLTYPFMTELNTTGDASDSYRACKLNLTRDGVCETPVTLKLSHTACGPGTGHRVCGGKSGPKCPTPRASPR